MADGHIKISTAIDNEGAKKNFEELKENIEKFGGEAEDKLKNELDKMVSDYEKMGNRIAKEIDKIQDAKSKLSQFDALDVEKTNLDNEIIMMKEAYDELNAKYKEGTGNIQETAEEMAFIKTQLKEMTAQSEQLGQAMEKVGAREDLSLKLKSAEDNAEGLSIQMERIAIKAGNQASKLQGVDEGFKKATKSANGLGQAVNKGVSKLGRYALALFSIRSVYSMLQRLSNNWLNSDNLAAKQTKATIDGMTNALSNLLAPAIQWITQLAAQALSVFASIMKLLFGIEVSTKGTSKNTSGISSGLKSANKEAKKFLASFDEINKISSETEDSSSGSSGVGTIDLPKVDDSLIVQAFKNMSKALEPFVNTLKSIDFNPLKDSLSKLGTSVMGTFSIIGQSITNMMNDTLGPFLKLLAEDIAPKAFITLSSIIDMLNPHLEWLLKNIVEPLFHWFMLDFVPAGFNTMIAVLELLLPVINAVLDAFEIVWKEIWEPLFAFLGDVAVKVLETITNMINDLTGKVTENDTGFTDFLTTLMRVGSYVLIIIGIVKTITTVVGALTTGVTLVQKAFSFLLYGLQVIKGVFIAVTSTVSGMIAVIALLVIAIIGIVTNWEQTFEDIKKIGNNIKGIFTGLLDFITGIFTGDWKKAWGGVVTAFTNIIGGLANVFRFPFNAIIDGINFFIKSLNKIKIPDWVPGVGGKGFNIGTIPRLQRGGVVNRPMQAMIGDGGKEAVIPLENDTRALEQIASMLSEFGGAGGDTQLVVQVGNETIFSAWLSEYKKKTNQGNGVLNLGF